MLDMTTRPLSASLIAFARRDMTLSLTDILRTIKAPQDASKRCSGKCFIVNRRWPFADTKVTKLSKATGIDMTELSTFRIAMPVTPILWYSRQNIACLDGVQQEIWSYFNMNTVFLGIRIPIINTRLSWDRLILMMGIPLSVRPHRYIDTPLVQAPLHWICRCGCSGDSIRWVIVQLALQLVPFSLYNSVKSQSITEYTTHTISSLIGDALLTHRQNADLGFLAQLLVHPMILADLFTGIHVSQF